MKSQVILLVGPPLSGKDTYLKTIHFSSFTKISRDDILMNLSDSDNYSDAFKKIDQSIVDRTLNDKIIDSVSNKDNVIINMTNLSKRGRRKHLSKFPSPIYEKIAIVFPKLELDEYLRRNDKRNKEENKFIPPSVIKDMIERWEDVTYDEGFDKIIKL
jgi:predicted kinase